MDKKNAISLLDETFNRPYDQTRFINFIKEFFNVFHISEKRILIPEVYQGYIQGIKYNDGTAYFQEFGEYTDASRKKIVILSIKLERSSSIERARTMQRNFVAKHLSENNKDAALVAFYGDDPEDWRFSFVKMEYHRERIDSGRIKVVKDLTPAKRYSYLVGVNEPNHTCKKQFLELVMEEKVNPSLDEVESVFSVEKVTNEFFEKYKELYHELRECMDKVLEKDPHVKEDFIKKNISTIDFAKKLLSQIVFLYFLQKKGWLGVERDESTGKFKEWGTGNKKFFTKLFKKEIVSYDNFFKEILEPIFYTALAFQRDDNYYTIFNYKCKIPFLNGGLFEPIEGYNWQETELLIDNSIFERIVKTFDEFNFTVKEDEPLEKEVAVDPEMLGKVFENLLDVNDRKSKGAFYTPREIVHYMCQQGLINYLETKTKEAKVDVFLEDIEKFIQFGDSSTSDDQRYLIEIRNLFDDIRSRKTKNIAKTEKQIQERINKLSLPASVIRNKELIDEMLAEIKVVDPAVGSGAFPVGMMNEIVKARSILTIFFDENIAKERTNYNLKRHTIEKSLYGIDLDPSAVDISKLRFWLSLIVDEEDIKNIQPLPNLDYKIMCGNSLLEEFEGIKLFNENPTMKQVRLGNFDGKETEVQKRLRKIKDLQMQYFGEQRKNKKNDLKGQIEEIEWELIEVTLKENGNKESIQKIQQIRKSKSKPFFLWRLHFADVFQRDNPGFDVVIANPPYVDSETMTKENPELREVYSKAFSSARGNWDLFIIFIEKGMELLRGNGTITYIVPNKVIAANYSEKLRQMLITKNIKELRDLSQVNVFKEVSVYPLIFLVQNNEQRDIVKMTTMRSVVDIEYKCEIDSEVFYNDIFWDRYFCPNKETLKIILKLSKLNTLGFFYPSTFGAATVNEAYKLKNFLKEYRGDTKSNFKKFINTGTIDPYLSLWGVKKTRYIKSSYDMPIILESELQSVSKSRLIQAKSPKIIIGGMTKRLECFLDHKGEFLAGKSTLVVLGDVDDLGCLVGILNSRLISLWYSIYYNSLSLSGGYLKIGTSEIKKIPIILPNKLLKIELINLVYKISDITRSSDYFDNAEKQSHVKLLVNEIDQFIYQLYDLTPEEVEVVENFQL